MDRPQTSASLQKGRLSIYDIYLWSLMSNRGAHITRVTDYDGRCMQLYPNAAPGQKREDLIKLEAGRLYKVTFKTKEYFESVGSKCFYPWVEVGGTRAS